MHTDMYYGQKVFSGLLLKNKIVIQYKRIKSVAIDLRFLDHFEPIENQFR